jgi:hypothetical protein
MDNFIIIKQARRTRLVCCNPVRLAVFRLERFKSTPVRTSKEHHYLKKSFSVSLQSLSPMPQSYRRNSCRFSYVLRSCRERHHRRNWDTNSACMYSSLRLTVKEYATTFSPKLFAKNRNDSQLCIFWNRTPARFVLRMGVHRVSRLMKQPKQQTIRSFECAQAVSE